MRSTILIYSGGLDSTVLLYQLLADGAPVKALSIDYGQRHRKELQHADTICQRLGVDHHSADLRSLTPFLSGSSQTSNDVVVPHGHYAEESMKLTVVPNRNMIMLSVAIAWAVSLKYDSVAYAAHAGDHAIYPDCRPVFVDAMIEAAAVANWHPVGIDRPFLTLTKADIVQQGHRLGVPFTDTWSCYKGGEIQCGECGTCVERQEAFQLANVNDPTIYDHHYSVRLKEANDLLTRR